MSQLSRFRTPGGFAQLLRLVETSPGPERDNLMELIAKEDPGWAHLIRLKTLTPERILSWPEKVLAQIWLETSLQLLIAVWQRAPAPAREKMERAMARPIHVAFRRELTEAGPVDDNAYAVAAIQLVRIVRDMQVAEKIRFEEVDPSLIFDPSLADRTEPFKRSA